MASKNITVLGDQGTDFIDFVLPNYNPTEAEIVINSNPPGQPFLADGTAYTTPQNFIWSVGSTHTLAVPNSGGPSIAVGWSDGETAGIQPSAGKQPARRTLASSSSSTASSNNVRNITVTGFGSVLQIMTLPSDVYNRYQRANVTGIDPATGNPGTLYLTGDELIDHKWPSMNTKGDMVWSQKNAAGSWQVVEQGPSTNNSRVPVTCTAPASCQAVDASAHDHQQAVIADDGTIAWFQDNTGGGLGYAIMRLDPGLSSPSVLEFSSRNHNCPASYPPPFYIPVPTGPCTNQEHDAGKNFGISSIGKTISYFTFYDEGDANDRPFDVNGQPLTDGSGDKLEFQGYDSPDISANSALVYSDDWQGLGNIYLAALATPLTNITIDGPGNPR